ncbi:hypothetical protein BU25DRAFT_489086 [Macroventuria anomochaeta]|uniref:Uncharacterized protein n=1 Tax=Macroventuria anomochaeta TaxID=301207 RepID=A0ACB6SAB7_9PLEO|nr:uncharacterized protein BU25DRAFT_489086 [Macroventuria anomochaeta]KAF2630269.1 hypothetical protein BU25DRAFT_489086 [Macroventuria anomochaeta]
MLTRLFAGQAAPQLLPPPPPQYRPPAPVSPTLPDMGFHNNRLREIHRKDESHAGHTPPQHTSRTSTEDFVKQEETPETKRKRKETIKMQTLHSQPVVDSARAADMGHIHFSETFDGFKYTSYSANNRHPHPYDSGVFHPWVQAPNNGGAFYNDGMPDFTDFVQSLSGDTLVPSSFVPGPFAVAEPTYPGGADPFTPASFAVGTSNTEVADGRDADFKQEDAEDEYTVSATPAEESDFAVSESEEERPRKTPKINKDGAPRKPRQPRPRLLKWSDDDWKNVCLGIVWACGETGVQIPFDQAAQIVGEKCTAGALQQALLKLRGKQIAEGHQIPNLKMAWTRKNKYAAPGAKTKASQEPEANRPRKKPTRMEATQCLIVTLPRAYRDQDRQGMICPYKWKKPPRKARSSTLRSCANMKQEVPQDQHDLGAFPYTAGGIPGDTAIYDYINDHEYLPATPLNGRQFYNSPPVTPFGQNTGYLQGMVIGGEEVGELLTTEGLHDLGNGFADATDDVFTI